MLSSFRFAPLIASLSQRRWSMKFGKISKRLRITIVLSVIWLIFILLAAVNDAGGYRFDFATFITIFFGLGVLPLIVLWGIIWIYRASKQNQKRLPALVRGIVALALIVVGSAIWGFLGTIMGAPSILLTIGVIVISLAVITRMFGKNSKGVNYS